MARKTIMVSDISNAEIPDGTGAVVQIKPTDGRRQVITLDVTDQEAEEIGKHGRKTRRRGRPPAQPVSA